MLKGLFAEERDWHAKQRQVQKDRDTLKQLKVSNRERAAHGSTSEFYAKKRDLKEIALKQKFD